ncbi:MAG: DUF4136 domain-containing protein [Pseudomonadota bacterium]
MTDLDPQQNFDGYRTFAWTSEEPMHLVGDRIINPLETRRIMEAIKTEFTAKGYDFVSDLDEADFSVSFSVGARDKIEISRSPSVLYSRWRWGYQYYGAPTIERNYTEGSLAIDAFDVSRKSPVWHGVTSGRINPRRVRPQAEIKTAVATILEDFPLRTAR